MIIKGRKTYFQAFRPLIIIEKPYLQTFLHSYTLFLERLMIKKDPLLIFQMNGGLNLTVFSLN